MKIAEQVTDEFIFEIECFDSESFDEFRVMMMWISENAVNGRVHFQFDGGVMAQNISHMWMQGRIFFTNDKDGVDAAAFKLKWL